MLFTFALHTVVTCWYPTYQRWTIDPHGAIAYATHGELCPPQQGKNTNPCMMQFRALEDGQYKSVYRPLCLVEEGQQ